MYNKNFNFQPDFNSLTLKSTGFGSLVPYKFPSVFVCCRIKRALAKRKKNLSKIKGKLEFNWNSNWKTHEEEARIKEEEEDKAAAAQKLY